MNEQLGDCSAILLVGEASFSFSASLTKCLGKNVKITASSFESEEDVIGRLRGSENMKLLKQHGAEVLFGIDATKLHETASLQGNHYDAIIFNFPHIGRKAGIKMNRQLLKDFFISCSHLLSTNGRVIVSLCNGQGGTPMDSPQREWNNSWQIVAMATYSSFILTEAMSFVSAFPGEYSNTGYRGQNKGFHSDGAITHVFEKSLPVPLSNTEPNTVNISVRGEGEHTICLPDELIHFKNRKLLNENNHPLHQCASQLLSDLQEHIPELQETRDSLPLVLRQSSPGCTAEYVIEGPGKVDICEPDERRTGADEKHSDMTNQSIDSISGYTLVSSTLQFIPAILDQHLPQAVTSKVFHKCEYSRHVLPIMHQMLIVLPQQNALWDTYEQIVICVLKHVLCSDMDIVMTPLASLKDVDEGKYVAKDQHQMLHHLACCLPKSMQVNDVQRLSILKEKMDIPIGVCGKVTLDSKHSKIILLSLDHIVMYKFSITDIRLIWSEDPRQWQNLQPVLKENKDKVRDLNQLIINPVSKFPTSYVHDLSFWVTKETQFNEMQFVSIVRKMAGLMVEEITLLDTYTDDCKDQVSLCYRLVYRSIDRALSKDQAAQIQLAVRETVAKEMSVNLR